MNDETTAARVGAAEDRVRALLAEARWSFDRAPRGLHVPTGDDGEDVVQVFESRDELAAYLYAVHVDALPDGMDDLAELVVLRATVRCEVARWLDGQHKLVGGTAFEAAFYPPGDLPAADCGAYLDVVRRVFGRDDRSAS